MAKRGPGVKNINVDAFMEARIAGATPAQAVLHAGSRKGNRTKADHVTAAARDEIATLLERARSKAAKGFVQGIDPLVDIATRKAPDTTNQDVVGAMTLVGRIAGAFSDEQNSNVTHHIVFKGLLDPVEMVDRTEVEARALDSGKPLVLEASSVAGMTDREGLLSVERVESREQKAKREAMARQADPRVGGGS